MPDLAAFQTRPRHAASVPLRDVAHARAGDKGDASILVIRASDPADFPSLVEALPVNALAAHFRSDPAHVSVIPVPGLAAMTIVVRARLAGGVTRSTRLDPHGKTLSGHLLDLEVDWRGRCS